MSRKYIPAFTTLLALAALSTSSLGITTSAKAADLPTIDGLYSPSGPPPKLSFWQGGYAGVQIGAGQFATRVTGGGEKKEFDDGSFAAGFYAGHNWHLSRFVLGLEADATWLGNKKSVTVGSLGRVKATNNWSLGAKARVGLPIDSFMPYLSAGLALSDYEFEANGTKQDSKNLSLSLGGGLEYALSSKTHLRLDYSLSGLNNMTKTYGGTSIKTEAANHRLMLGVSYQF